MDYNRLKALTGQLRNLNKRAEQQYLECTKAEGYEVDFYNEVKPFTDQVQVLVDEWEPLARDWAIRERPKYIYPIQIRDTAENLTIIAVQAFQTDTKGKRFVSMINSIDYNLEAMEKQLKAVVQKVREK